MLKQQHLKPITATQTEVIPQTRPQEKIIPQNNRDASKRLPNANVNNSLLKQNKEKVKKRP